MILYNHTRYSRSAPFFFYVAIGLFLSERNRQRMTDQKVRKAQQHVTRARAVAAAQKQKEAADLGTKKQNIDRQLQEAQDRREAFLAEKIAPAERANLQVQSVANEQSNLLREKRAALEQKQKDATARRNVAESHKARHTPVVSLNTNMHLNTNTNSQILLQTCRSENRCNSRFSD